MDQGFQKLEHSLIDVIKEEQAKLGYQKEKIQLYYPLSSLNHFFSTQDSEEEMAGRLKEMTESIKRKLGDVAVSHKKDRFCFHIPEEGSVYVHEHTQPDEFIRALIQLIPDHDCTIERIRELFDKYWAKIEFTKMDSDEFDYLIRFLDKEDDPYYYCFKDEGCHFIYHRFLPEDYQEFGF